MLRRVRFTSWLFVGVLLWTGSSMAGPVWDETVPGTDAGRLPMDAKNTTPLAVLRGIHGRLAGTTRGPSDFEDMFLIDIPDVVDDPVVNYLNFCARTDGGGPLGIGFTTFNSQLFLFQAGGASDGLGLLANDDISLINTASLVGAPDDDGFFPALPGPGLYFLAITGSNNDPISAAGAIFDQTTTTEVSGPDGPGGGSAIIDWSGPTDTGAVGEYVIEICPEPSSLLILLAGSVLIVARRR